MSVCSIICKRGLGVSWHWSIWVCMLTERMLYCCTLCLEQTFIIQWLQKTGWAKQCFADRTALCCIHTLPVYNTHAQCGRMAMRYVFSGRVSRGWDYINIYLEFCVCLFYRHTLHKRLSAVVKQCWLQQWRRLLTGSEANEWTSDLFSSSQWRCPNALCATANALNDVYHVSFSCSARWCLEKKGNTTNSVLHGYFLRMINKLPYLKQTSDGLYSCTHDRIRG